MRASWPVVWRATPQRRLAAVLHGLLRPSVGVLLCCFAAATVVAFCAAATSASAESLCTDTWSGPTEGVWQTAANWSASHVPTSSDVACIGAGKTAQVTGGTNQAGVVQGEGTLAISGGSLEVANALEPSSLARLSVLGGALTGAAEVDVTTSFTGGSFGTMAGPGSTVIGAAASGSLVGTTSWALLLSEGRTLRNAGSLTIGKGSGILGQNKAKLINTGTLTLNGEGASENHGLIASPGEATLTNTGIVTKTEGSATTPIQFGTENEGTIGTTSGTIELTGGGTSGKLASGSWSASGTGASIRFNGGGSTFALGATVPLSGKIEQTGGTVAAGKLEGPGATLSVSGGTMKVDGTSPSTVANLVLLGTTTVLAGTGEIDVTTSFTGGSFATMSGAGSTVIESGASGSLVGTSSWSLFLNGYTLRNAGSLTTGKPTGILGQEHARLINSGTLILNGETAGENHGLIASEKEATLINTGVVRKTEGSGITPIQFAFENLGSITAETGSFQIYYPIAAASSTQYGGFENPSAPGRPHPTCGKPVSCATGNEATSQTDFAIGGRGVGLDLTRTYNSQAAAAGTTGPFGHGWSSSFSDHLAIEPSEKRATLYQANGSTVPFAESGASFVAPTWTQDTLTGSAEAGYTLTYPDQTRYKFAGVGGRLESVTDRNGNATTLSYGESGRLEAITDPASRKITLAYNGEGLVESATDPMGHVVTYTYEGGDLASVTEPGETEPRWRFKYDGSHQLTELTDGRGGKTINEYNAAHQVVSQTDPLKHLLTFEYEPFETKITNHATGNVTDEHFTSSYLPVSITRGFGTASASTESFSYDGAGNVLSTTDANGHTTKYTYDAASNRMSTLDPDKNETKLTYDAMHDVVTTTTPNGETTTIERDTSGNAIKISRPAPGAKTQVTKYKYAAHGELESVTDPLERTTKYEYDAQGDRTDEIDAEADKRTWAYNEDSQETATVNPRGVAAGGTKEAKYKTTIERDAQGRPTLVVGPLKHETKYSYDGNGNLATVTDPELNKTTYTYDADNEAVKVEEANGTITETGYDGSGRVTSQTDGNKHTTTYVRNVLGDVTEVIDPLGRKTLKEYDAAGNLTALTDAAKRTTKYTYDPANRLTEVDYSGEATPDVKYEYDPDGNRTKMVDGTGTSKYTYDELDRLTESKDGHGDVVGYEYDLANEQTKITYPSGKFVTRAYDNVGRLKSVTDWLEHTSKFVYDADSNQTATTFPSGTGNEDTYTYNEADAMSEVKMANGAETLASLVYARNKDGGVTKATTKGLPGEEIPAFAYDVNSRLTKGAGIAYKYDAADNTTKIGAGAYTYDAASQLEKGPSLTYTYDELGERTKTKPSSGPSTTYGYDQAGDLTSVARSHEGEVPAIEDSYGYDGDGLRASQTISGSTSYMSWDVAAPLPLLLSDGASAFIYGPGGLPIEQISGETMQYLHHDQQGSTRMITGATGTVAGTTTFDAYGNKLGSTGSATSALGYDGEYTDSDTGLIYLRARVYDPATSQFLSVDPAAGQTRARYDYANADPIQAADPSGLSWFGDEIVEGVLEPLGTRYVGFVDGITRPFFGGTAAAREALGLNGGLDTCGFEYQLAHQIGEYTLGAELVAAAAGGRVGAAGEESQELEVTFGHGFRHLEGTGLTQEEVEAAIEQQVRQSVQGAKVSGPFGGRVSVGGQTIEYRGYGLDTGRIHIGTYYPAE
jgi:RHS repeat-associated protein